MAMHAQYRLRQLQKPIRGYGASVQRRQDEIDKIVAQEAKVQQIQRIKQALRTGQVVPRESNSAAIEGEIV